MASGRWVSTVAAFLGVFVVMIPFCFGEKAPYNSFTKDATSAPPIPEYYDYIIVGGGTASCALAATLSTSAKVLLLERGGWPYDNPHVSHKDGFVKTLLDTSPSSAAQQFVSTDGVFNHRARILGGGSAINAGFYTRASDDYVREAGWDTRLVNASYEWVEKKIVYRPRVLAWQEAVRNGLLEAGVLPDRGFTYEHLLGTKISGTIFDENGYRHTAADLLEYADQARIMVYLHATTQQILMEISPGQRPKAYGVLFTDSAGATHNAYLNNGSTSEVILSAGTLGSPQILMLSGIGPANQLRAQGIKVILDQQLVGQGMSDNPFNIIIIPSSKPVGYSLVQVVGITDVGSFIEALSGYLDFAEILKLAQDFAKLANQTIPPLETLTNQALLKALLGSNPHQNLSIQIGLIGEKIDEPFSTGYLELKSKDPNDNPRVTFNYFQDPRDLKKCVKGLEIIKKVIESRPISEFQYPFSSFQSLMKLMLVVPNNLRKRHLSATYSLKQFCMDTLMTIWHFHGGCQVNRVVDNDYRVLGVDALRVVDSSTFRNTPGTNPQATVMMLGRYMGQKILRERIPNLGV